MQQFKGKHIAVVGLSTEGLDSVHFLVSEGASVTCCDRRSEKELGATYKHLTTLPVSFQLGFGYLAHLSEFAMVVRTAGMALSTKELVAYQKAGGTLTSLTKLFFALCRGKIIGVTGTKGKGTTSSLIAAMLQQSGLSVYLGGNVGTPLLSRVPSIQPNDWVVFELSSFQLEDLTQSPHIAVVLPITQDHLVNLDPLATNYHKTRDAYIASKTSIVRYQTARDAAIINSDNEVSRSFATMTQAKTYLISRKNSQGDAPDGTSQSDAWVGRHEVFVRWQGQTHSICSASAIHLRGDHNLENIAAAACTALVAGCSIAAIGKATREFKGLPHRLQLVRTVDGVSYYNDTFSTVPETTVAAIRSFSEPIVLVVGGSEKGSDFNQLGVAIAKSSVRSLVVIGQMTDRIAAAVQKAGFGGAIITGAKNMRQIVRTAKKEARPGDIVLLSPACASFDMFPNYKERGNQFIYEVSHLSDVSS